MLYVPGWISSTCWGWFLDEVAHPDAKQATQTAKPRVDTICIRKFTQGVSVIVNVAGHCGTGSAVGADLVVMLQRISPADHLRLPPKATCRYQSIVVVSPRPQMTAFAARSSPTAIRHSQFTPLRRLTYGSKSSAGSPCGGDSYVQSRWKLATEASALDGLLCRLPSSANRP